MAGTLANEPLDTLHRGTHTCLIHRGLGEYMDSLARALARAEAKGQRVLWIGRKLDTRPIQDLLGRVGSPGRRANGRMRSTLRVVDDSLAVSSQRTLDPGALIRLLREETTLALDDGYMGLQVIQEMSGWMGTPRDIEAVKRYDAALSTFLPGTSCSVLCLYDRECSTPDQLLDLLDVRPHVPVDGES